MLYNAVAAMTGSKAPEKKFSDFIPEWVVVDEDDEESTVDALQQKAMAAFGAIPK